MIRPSGNKGADTTSGQEREVVLTLPAQKVGVVLTLPILDNQTFLAIKLTLLESKKEEWC